ncbi:hypothetical protein K443DRAFT_107764 [Laccaria amethystina LaAM-08-1]|uniref:Uncharacterized protein n=1 Tax=Laccaria amethystina LaAM-08-1 TaxID=1095629 RepID=A0A0C9XIT2_9AGAR|nr:hypothetical protein K443DRAFT_107764 [Laccaria amethystina LaAM-08-1]
MPADVISGHYALWKKGFKHGNISFDNLRLDPIFGAGVLNDFDFVNGTGRKVRGLRFHRS